MVLAALRSASVWFMQLNLYHRVLAPLTHSLAVRLLSRYGIEMPRRMQIEFSALMQTVHPAL